MKIYIKFKSDNGYVQFGTDKKNDKIIMFVLGIYQYGCERNYTKEQVNILRKKMENVDNDSVSFLYERISYYESVERIESIKIRKDNN